MYFFYLDSQAELHVSAILQKIQPVVDLDLHWLTIGHKVFPQRLHAMACFEKISREIDEDHQFTYRYWFDGQTRCTHCLWYAVPKIILKRLPDEGAQAKSLAFILPRYFPPTCRNKSLICFVDLPECEAVLGYVRGHCVCFKKLPPRVPLNVQQEWQYLQQAYPQWDFECSLCFTSLLNAENTLVHTHQETIQIDVSTSVISNRIKLYGLD